MSVNIKAKCLHASTCKFGDNCLMNKSFHEGGTYDPVIKIRIIKCKKSVQCFSYTPKIKGEENGREEKRNF